MNVRTMMVLVALGLLAPVAGPASAQGYIAPHSNDPHPPANQPAYQLPSPLSRPGVPGYPGAAHSNDPHFTKTEPMVARSPPVIAPPVSTVPPYLPSYPTSTRQRPRDGSAASRSGAKAPVVTLEQCYRKWDARLRVSKASWEQSCRRLEAEGRIGRR